MKLFQQNSKRGRWARPSMCVSRQKKGSPPAVRLMVALKATRSLLQISRLRLVRPRGRSCETRLLGQCSKPDMGSREGELQNVIVDMAQVTSVNASMLRTFWNVRAPANYARVGSRGTPTVCGSCGPVGPAKQDYVGNAWCS